MTGARGPAVMARGKWLVAVRLVLDGAAAVLMVAALAYWWLDNRAHEVIGTSLFALVALHALVNRRWYGGLFRGRYNPPRGAATAVVVAFGAAMAVLLVTSLLISRDVFAALGVGAGVRLREVHLFAAYWSVAILGLHLGVNWLRVMQMARVFSGLRGRSVPRMVALRGAAALIALRGVAASAEMGFGDKLALTVALDMWDFSARTPRFFMNYGSILGLYAVLGHAAMALLRRRGTSSPA